MELDTGFWLLFPAALAAVGTGVLTWQGGRALHQVLTARLRRWTLPAYTAATEPTALPVEELYGIPPLAPYMVGLTLLGTWLSWHLLIGGARLVGPLAGLLPLLWKRERIRAGKQQVRREVAELVESLRLYLAVASSPGAALTLALNEERAGIVWRRLRRHRDILYLSGIEAVLSRVAVEVDSPDLHRLLARLRAAQAGSGAFTPALQAAAADLAAELRREIEEVIEAAPTRLILPLIALFLPPLLMLALSAPVQAFLDALAGMGGPLPLLGP